MRIAVFGLGYVGAVTASCLASDGHTVVGVDPDPTKVDFVNQGAAPVVESGLGDLIADAVRSGNLRATRTASEAVGPSEALLICVGTPSNPNGSLDLTYVERVCREIGAELGKVDNSWRVVVARSTMLPGTMMSVVVPTLEAASGKAAGTDFGVCLNPEFLREGTAVADFHHPPKTVIGQSDQRSGNVVAALYRHQSQPLIRTDIATAEMIKYTDNAWHALKICFANEIGNIAKKIGIDGHEVMDIFCQDTKLNLSPYYLKPGFAFGGSCLPKDIRALTYRARELDLDVPILSSILASNARQLETGLQMVLDHGGRKVGLLGLSFKAGTDDLRESPLVDLAERLIGKGYDLRIYDRDVLIANLIGTNREYIMNGIPHISALMVDEIDELLEHAETIIIGNGDPEFASVPSRLKGGQRLVDLVRVTRDRIREGAYDGICW